MSRQDFYYPSADGINQIHAAIWTPECEPKAVVQIVHGMIEHIGRYADFAEFLNKHGYVVVGEDHLGHGGSVAEDSIFGYFGDDGNRKVISDIDALRVRMAKEYEGIPYIILGHSMGSFLTRQYITENDCKNAEGLAGVIIMGTGWQPKFLIGLGKFVAKTIGLFKGEKATSRFIDKLVIGPYLKKIENPKTVSDWLTRDEEIVKQYRSDPYCRFHFTTNAYYNMFKGIGITEDKKRIRKLPEGLPLLFIAGAEDPVGNYGEAVRKAFMVYTENSKCQTDIKLYDDARHEVLNEINRDEVYNDLLEWIDCCVEDRK